MAAAAGAFKAPFAGVIRIEPDGAAPIFIDGRVASPVIAATEPADAAEASQCVWRAARDTLLQIFEEERALTGSFVSGRLIIAGDMSVMARLQMDATPPSTRAARPHG